MNPSLQHPVVHQGNVLGDDSSLPLGLAGAEGRRSGKMGTPGGEQRDRGPASKPRVQRAHVAAPEAQAPAAQDEPTRQNIIWIASYPKSGNTWVRAFLHNLMLELRGESDTVQHINRMHEHTAWEILNRPYEAILGRKIAEVPQAEIARIRPEVQRRLANSRTAPFLVKTHLCRSHDYGHPTINLEATLAAIYIVRNPLDVAISYAHHSGHTLDWTIQQLGQSDFRTVTRERAVFELIGSWSLHAASWIGCFQRPVHLLRYEDLLKNPVQQFGKLARFLGLEPRLAQIEAAVLNSSLAELRNQEQQRGFIERPATSSRFFREGRDGQWRDDLTADQAHLIARGHAPMMQRFGYLTPSSGVKSSIL